MRKHEPLTNHWRTMEQALRYQDMAAYSNNVTAHQFQVDGVRRALLRAGRWRPVVARREVRL